MSVDGVPSGTQESLGRREFSTSASGSRVGRGNVELVDYWYLQQVHLRSDDHHMIGSNLHPIRCYNRLYNKS